MKTTLRVLRLLVVLSSLAQVAWPAGALAAEKKHVLVLHSYHKGLEWTDGEDAGISSVLQRRARDTTVHTEYMDVKRVPGGSHQPALEALYAQKYRDLRLGAVIAVDDDAYRFALRHRDALFPGAAIVFCGVNYFEGLEDEPLRDEVTGVVEAFDARETIRTALRLGPGTKRIVIINDGTTTTTGRANARILQEVIPEFQGQVAFRFVEDTDMREVLAEVRRLSRGDVILLMTFNRDRAGHIFDYDESISLIAAEAQVPMYSVWDFYLGNGIVGGMLTSGIDQGRTAAELALRILDGASPRDLPVVRASPNRYMFDRVQLERFGFSLRDLPKDSILINVAPSFYALNKRLVRGAVAGAVAAVILIALLLANVVRRRREAATQRFLAEVSARLAASLNVETTGLAAVHLPVPQLGDAALLWMCAAEREDPLVWFAHAAPERAAEMLPRLQAAQAAIRSDPCVRRALDTGRPVFRCWKAGGRAPDWAEELREREACRADATFPLVGGGRVVGALSLFRSGRGKWTDDEVALATEVARRTATALLNASLFQHAEEAVHARDEFLAVASHELKTPLTPLSISIQTLQRMRAGGLSKVPQKRLDDVLHRAEEQIRRLVGLVDDLLDVTRLTAHRLRLKPRRTDLGAAVRKVIERHRLELAEAGCSLSDAIAPEVVGHWDRSRVEQVFTNLLTNAMKYAPGPIDVAVEVDGPIARLIVRDRGPGIAPKDRERIFLPFERAISYVATSGFGLGLFIVRQIVDAHGGVIRLDSTPGAGSTFVVELPRQRLAAA